MGKAEDKKIVSRSVDYSALSYLRFEHLLTISNQLKSQWKAFRWVMSQSGFGYDTEKFLITAPKSVWTQLAEVRYQITILHSVSNSVG